MTEQPDQLRAPENTATETTTPAETTEPPEAVAARRILKLRRRHPEETPAQLTERLKQRFIQDFSLVGGAEVGATHLVPGTVATATRNPKIAGATRAAAQLGVVQESPPTPKNRAGRKHRRSRRFLTNHQNLRSRARATPLYRSAGL